MTTETNLPGAVPDPDRRKFIGGLSLVAGSALFMNSPAAGFAESLLQPDDPWTVGRIMDLFISQVPGAPLAGTVDTLKAGSRDTRVTGILTTMFATIEVIQKAISMGVNFIIAHEPTFYNHADETKWLANDSVYLYKEKLLKDHQISIWRNHDYIHHLVPDGVKTGVISQLGWKEYYNPETSSLVLLPAVSLKSLIEQLKSKLDIPAVRYIGDLSQSCHKILLMPGASGGTRQIGGIMQEKPDVLVCGEISEWETAEYVRDARAKGQQLSLVLLGHIASEEPGSEFMAGWLRQHVPGIKVTHVPAKNSLSFL